MEKQKSPIAFSLQFPWDKKNQDIRISTGPVRTCENQSPLVELTPSSLCSQFILLVCDVTKVGKENSMHSLLGFLWELPIQILPNFGAYWYTQFLWVLVLTARPPKPKNTTASKKINLLEACLYTGFTRKVQIQFSWYFLYFFTPPSLFLSIRINVSSNKYWGHLTLTKGKKISYLIILKTWKGSKHCFYAV